MNRSCPHETTTSMMAEPTTSSRGIRRLSSTSSLPGEPERKMRRLSSSSIIKTGRTSLEFHGIAPLCVNLPKDGDLSERELKEYLLETYKDDILDRMRIVSQDEQEDVVTVSTTTDEGSTPFASLDSFQSSHGETMQELTFVKQRLELLEKVALVQKQYLECEGPKVVYTYLLEGLLDLVDSEFGFIGEVKYDEDDKMYLHVHRATNIAWDEATKKFYEENEDNLRFYNMDTLFGRTLLEKRPILSNERATKTPKGHPFIEAFMGIPFFSETGEVIGMLGVANKPGGYGGADVEFLDPFTATCGNIIQSYRQIEKNKELIDTLEEKVQQRTEALEVTNQELAEANRLVVKAKEMQLQHFACMSHEIRTPLNCIVGLLSLLQGTELSPSQQESVNLIVSSSDLLATVVNDVLDYSKLETGHVDINVQKCRLQDTLNSILHGFRSKAEAKNISLVTDFSASVPTHIETDSQRLQQVLFNLLGNAIKFSSENSIVELHISVCDDSETTDSATEPPTCPVSSTRMGPSNQHAATGTGTQNVSPPSGCPFHKGTATSKSFVETIKDTFCPFLGAKTKTTPSKCPFSKGASESTNADRPIKRSSGKKVLRFVVKDFGRGIEASELENIFKPFKQANSETEAEFGGTGLGLAITDKLVKGLGGTISVNSRIGEYSEFVVDLPLVADQAKVLPHGLNIPVAIVHSSCDDEVASHLKRTFESSSMTPVFYESMQQLHDSFGNSKRRPIACLCNESLYDDSSQTRFLSDLSVFTFGPEHSVQVSDRHYQFVSNTLPAEILQPIHEAAAKRCPSLAHSSSASSIRSIKSDGTASDNSSLRVLVAEDNKINRKVISSILARIGVVDVTLVENGQLAVEAEAANTYDVILMDMQMPVMGGVEACRRITSRPREIGDKAPVVVFVTANVSQSHEKECIEAGGTEFLPKPFNVKKLQAMFDKVRDLCQRL